MTIELTGAVEEQLRDLAVQQGRDMGVLVEEAVREYLEAAAINDVSAAEVAESQVALVAELRGVPEWTSSGIRCQIQLTELVATLPGGA